MCIKTIKQSVKILLISLIILLLNSGCAEKEFITKIEYVNIPQKCIIPDTIKPEYDNSSSINLFEASKKSLNNFIECSNYNEKLEESISICK